MKRRLLKLGVFLLLGAIVNVAVAAAASAVSVRILDTEYEPQHFTHAEATRIWESHFGRGYLAEGRNIEGWMCSVAGVTQIVLLNQKVEENGRLTYACYGLGPHVFIFQNGWPFRSFEGWQIDDAPPSEYKWCVEVPYGVQRALSSLDFWPGVIPCKPIWPGFAINTIFYAAILWLQWVAPGRAKRFIRVHRGRCPACGFIIAPGTAAASGGPCSECGAVLPQKLRRSNGM